MASKKVISDTFIGEIYKFDSEEARTAFRKNKNSIGAGILVSTKKEHGTLTLDILNPLIEAAKPVDTRKNLTEDGTFTCVGAHKADDKSALVRARGFDRLDKDGNQIPDKVTGKPQRLGRFFEKSRLALEKMGLKHMIPAMVSLTGELTGKDAGEAKSLVGVVCKTHFDTLRGLMFFTDKATVLEKRAASETFYGQRAEEYETAKAEKAAIEAAKAKKFAKAKGSDRNFGRGDKKSIPFGPIMLNANSKEMEEAFNKLVAAYGDKFMEFSKSESKTLEDHFGVPERVAAALIRRMTSALATQASGGATLGDRIRKPVTDRGRRRQERKERKSREAADSEE